MTITLNGEERSFAEALTVSGLLVELGVDGRRGVAVALESEVVPRSAWERTFVEDGARVEVLVAVQGG
jgi:sulfur carrier protein